MGGIRLFLALVVAIGHFRFLATANSLEPRLLGFGPSDAVMMFYVISGFLISMTLSTNYERTSTGVLLFYRRRFVRIFSLYWPVVLISFVLAPPIYNFIELRALDQVTTLFLFGADINAALADYPVINGMATPFGAPQAWTLSVELMFYVFAPFVVQRTARIILLLSVAFAGYIAALHLGTPHLEIWAYRFGPSTLAFFFIGALAYRLGSSMPFLQTHLVWAACLIIVALIKNIHHRSGADIALFWVAICLFALALPGLFEATKRMKFLNFLGNLSYPLYLTHYFVLLALLHGQEQYSRIGIGWFTSADLLSTVQFASICIAVATIVHVLVEAPISESMNRVAARRKIANPSIAQ
jgi:peptidoglycan/LPS O-acetylase OafA/YrhL